MKQDQKQYDIDRKAASRLLKVSIRTVDRHIKNKKLSIQEANGRIWLNKEEIRNFYSRQSGHDKVDNVDSYATRVSIDDNVDKVDNVDTKIDNVELIKKEKSANSGAGTFKKLYEELKEEVKEKQIRLEIANYRVGQLENQVKNSIPLLEYHRENFECKKHEEEFQSKITEKESILQKILVQLKREKFNKRIFLIILLTILALQPLWLLVIYK